MNHLINSVLVLLILATQLLASSASSHKDFSAGLLACEQNDFATARNIFVRAIQSSPSEGAFLNLGCTEWQLDNTARAIIAWERALLLNPRSRDSENNLSFAREIAQLESPDWTWCEIAASWLPEKIWAWIACASFWFAIGMLIVPGVLRWKKTATQQAAVALGLVLFLLSLPANYGIWTRSRIGFAYRNDTALKLTPTKDGEPITRLAAGEPGRVLRERGNHLLIRTRRMTGWIERDGFEFITPRKSSQP